MQPPRPSINPPVYRGDEKSRPGRFTLDDIAALRYSPDWLYIGNVDIVAASPTYAMAAVPDGFVRVVIRAVVREDGPGTSQIYVTRLGLDVTVSSSTAGLGGFNVSMIEMLLLKAGDVLTLDATTAIGDGGILYIDLPA